MYKILFVDDDTTISFIIKRYKFWEYSQFHIDRFAENGKEALDILQKERFDLVITDIRMPFIDGLELVRKMRDRGDKTCVLLASTYSDFKYAKEGIRLGALDYIEKPYTQEKLEEALVYARQYLTQNQSENAAESIYEVMLTQRKRIQLYEMLMEGRDDALSFCCNMAEELEEVYPEQREERAAAMEYLLNEVWRQMGEEYPWIPIKESLDIHINDAALICDTRNIFIYIREIVQKYDLSHPASVIPRTCRFMAEHLEEDNLIDKVSREVELSRDYLGRIFKARTEYSLSEFSTALKIGQAKKLLTESNMKIYEISDRLGYATVDYFSRLFRNYTGQTPAAYRKNNGILP